MSDDIESQKANSFYSPHEEEPVQTVKTSGNDDEYLHIGDTKIRRTDLMLAFGGEMRPGVYTPPSRKFANPTPMGLMAFGITTFVLSLCNAHARHVATPNIAVGLAYAFGGLVQLLAGMWEMAVENTFGATSLSSFGGFWLSFAIIQTGGFGITAAYEDEAELNSALGFYMMGWFMFTFMLMLCTVRSTVAFFGLFFTLTLTFLLLGCFYFTGKVGVQKAAGWLGIVTSFFSFYNAMAGLANYENSYIDMTKIMVPMPGAQHLRQLKKMRSD